MTPSCRILSKLLLQPSFEFTESIDNKKNKFWSQGAPANRPPIWVFQVKKQHFLINSRIRNFFFIIIFGGARSPGGVRLSIRPVWSLTLPVIFESPQWGMFSVSQGTFRMLYLYSNVNLRLKFWPASHNLFSNDFLCGVTPDKIKEFLKSSCFLDLNGRLFYHMINIRNIYSGN